MSNEFRFAWPASAILRRGHGMALLYRMRGSLPERTPITQLIAHAINHTYGQCPTIHQATTQHSKKEDHDQTKTKNPASGDIFPEAPAA